MTENAIEFDLVVAPGEIVAFLGSNGADKTSTLDMLLGLSRPDFGTVRLFGMDPRTAVESGRVAAVLQSGGLLKDLTIAETARLVGSLYTAPRPVEDVLARAGIADIADRLVRKCSGAQSNASGSTALRSDSRFSSAARAPRSAAATRCSPRCAAPGPTSPCSIWRCPASTALRWRRNCTNSTRSCGS